VFASACCHGFIIWLADMIRCGELWVIYLIESYKDWRF
jgi:hypothetical protein